MKKILCLVLVLCGVYSLTIAQVSIRPQIGVNFASFTEDLLDEAWDTKVGYQIGADVQIGGLVYFQPGLNYESTKLTFKGMESVDLTTERLNIPILVGIRIYEKEGSTLSARVFGGPNMAFHLNEDMGDGIEGLSSDDFKTAQFSLLAGAGVDFGLLFVDLGYKFGFSDFIQIDDLNEDTKLQVFILNGGIRIGF